MGGNVARVVAQVLVQLSADGRVHVQAEGPGGMVVMLGMMEVAKAELLKAQAKAAEGPRVEAAPVGFVVPRVG